jgi:hypothetical protein
MRLLRVSTKVNCGLNKVRLPSPVKVGSRYLQTPLRERRWESSQTSLRRRPAWAL